MRLDVGKAGKACSNSTTESSAKASRRVDFTAERKTSFVCDCVDIFLRTKKVETDRKVLEWFLSCLIEIITPHAHVVIQCQIRSVIRIDSTDDPDIIRVWQQRALWRHWPRPMMVHYERRAVHGSPIMRGMSDRSCISLPCELPGCEDEPVFFFFLHWFWNKQHLKPWKCHDHPFYDLKSLTLLGTYDVTQDKNGRLPESDSDPSSLALSYNPTWQPFVGRTPFGVGWCTLDTSAMAHGRGRRLHARMDNLKYWCIKFNMDYWFEYCIELLLMSLLKNWW